MMSFVKLMQTFVINTDSMLQPKLSEIIKHPYLSAVTVFTYLGAIV